MIKDCLPNETCHCICHRVPGVKHVIACCDQGSFEQKEALRKMQEEAEELGLYEQ